MNNSDIDIIKISSSSFKAYIPIKPKELFNIFNKLAEKINKLYCNQKILLIGFSEISNAVSEAIAANINCLALLTALNKKENIQYTVFGDYKVIKSNLDCAVKNIDRIIFIKDESTKTKFILNVIDNIENIYCKKIKFSVASIFDKNTYDENLKIKYYDMINKDIGYECIKIEYNNLPDNIEFVNGDKNNGNYNLLFKNISNDISLYNKSILIIGLEDFLFPALYVSYKMEQIGNNVYFQHTTAFEIDNYSIKSKYYLTSVYNVKKKVFIYNLKKYDCIIIVADMYAENKTGFSNLIAALKSYGNKNIYIIKWRN